MTHCVYCAHVITCHVLLTATKNIALTQKRGKEKSGYNVSCTLTQAHAVSIQVLLKTVLHKHSSNKLHYIAKGYKVNCNMTIFEVLKIVYALFYCFA